MITDEDSLRKSLEIVDANGSFRILSIPMRCSKYNAAKTIEVVPENSEWNIRLLSVFINQLEEFRLDPSNGCRCQFNTNKENYFFFKFIANPKDSDEELHSRAKKYFLIDILKDIKVRASKAIVDKWEDENYKKSWMQKCLQLDLTGSSIALLKNTPLIYYPQKDFSSLFNSFSSSFVNMRIGEKNIETLQIYDYVETFKSERFYEQFTFERLCKTNEGYLRINLAENNDTNKVLDKLNIGGKDYFITGGTYITPWASSLLRGKTASGIILDTTWNLLQHYVCSIPTLAIQNVGLPIGFTFSLVEDAAIYKDFFSIFQNAFGFPIQEYISVAMSDQGSPLKSAIKDLGLEHIFCLRHLLVSLKKTSFSQQIGNLVSAPNEYDFNELIMLYSEKWKTITDDKELKQLNRILRKIGLCFNEKIEIENEQRWQQVSMMHRAKYRMPSCTNQLESTHGHMNSNIPRRNCMWPSVERIIHSIMKKNQMFESHFKHNYLRYKTKTKNICANTPENIMEKMIHYYKTDLKTYSCNCGETTLLSSMIQESLPCSHLHYMGVQFPDIAAPNIMISNSTRGELIVEYNFVKSEKIITDDDYYSRIRKYASKVIQKYTHRKKEDCIEYVNRKLQFKTEPSKFILGYPIEVFDVIDEGIRHFHL